MPIAMVNSSRARLLVIADDGDLRDAMASLALQEGYDVLAAATAVEAIDLLETTSRPHLAVVDPRAPGVLGRTVLEYVHDDVRLRRIPLCVLDEPYDPAQLLGFVRGALVA